MTENLYNLKPDELFDQQEHQPALKQDAEDVSMAVEHENDEESAEFNDPSSFANASSGIVKNLRIRKNINYNEDKMLKGPNLSGELSLSGSKRFKSAAQSFVLEGDENLSLIGKNKR